MMLACLNLIALAFHTAADLLCAWWRAARTKLAVRVNFFNHMRVLTARFIFPSWTHLLDCLADSKRPLPSIRLEYHSHPKPPRRSAGIRIAAVQVTLLRYCGRPRGHKDPFWRLVFVEDLRHRRSHSSMKVGAVRVGRESTIYPDLLKAGKNACVLRLAGFGWRHDSRRLSQRRGSQGADRAGARRLVGVSRDAARQRPGAFG